MRSICFVNSDNYPVLNPKYGSHYIGGESVQHTLLAREFARRGWDVSMVCDDFGQDDGEVIDEITIWKTFASKEGLPGFRFIYPRLYRIWRALRNADADIYYQSCAGVMTGFVAAFCRRYGRRMVFRVAHDSDCKPGEQLIRFTRDRKIYEYGLRHADMISAQSDVQKAMLDQNYGLASIITNMVVDVPQLSLDQDKDIDVLWVNNLRDFKRPDILLDISRALPDISFTMIGGPVQGHEQLHRDVTDRVGDIPNLSYLGAVPYGEVNGYFHRARLFLNTSDSEGFPNSFLQAWVRAVPVISFFDPDSLIDSKDLGASPDSIEGACAAIRQLLGNDEQRQQMGKNAREIIVGRHSSSVVADQYLAQFQSRLA